MKYHIEGVEEKRVRIRPGPAGMVRDFLWGVVVALPWVIGGMAVFFLPDYIGAYRHDPELLDLFWTMALFIFGTIVLTAGYRRATSLAWAELDSTHDEVVFQYRTFLLSEGERVVYPLSAVKHVDVEKGAPWQGSRLVVHFSGGVAEVLARVIVGETELEALASACKRVLEPG